MGVTATITAGQVEEAKERLIRKRATQLDALVARLIYRWRLQAIGRVLLLIALIGLGSGLIPPFWKGRAALAIVTAPGAAVRIDGRDWPRPLYAGQHAIRSTLPDGRGAWADITLHSSQALTLTLSSAGPARPN